MNEYTREAPFEHEGVKVYVYRAPGISIDFFVNGEWVAYDHGRAIHAFIEAERNEWSWTNDEHTEARKGRWTVQEADVGVGLDVTHDDFPRTCWYSRTGEAGGAGPDNDVADVVRDFLAWRAARDQPAEPTEFGDSIRDANGVRHALVEPLSIPRVWVSESLVDGVDRFSWTDITSRGAVTILSTGVES